MRNYKIVPLVVLLMVIISGCSKKQPVKIPDNEKVGEFAPPDAYINGSKHPYYGAENAWDIEGTALKSRFFERDPKLEYKRRGQRALLEILAEKPERAEEYCRKLLSKDSQDLESYFNLAIALAHENKMDEAVKTVKTAVERGLPLGRFLAGPRDILKPLVESDSFKKYAAPFNLEVIQGPMVGKVSDHSASFWVRTYHQVNINVKLSNQKSMSRPFYSNTIMSDSSKDYTAIVSVERLKPDTWYYYEVLVNGDNTANTVIHSFRTFPSEGSKAEFKVVFGGGAGYVPWHERIWDVIKGHRSSRFPLDGR